MGKEAGRDRDSRTTSSTDVVVNVPVKLKLQHPPSGKPQAFDYASCPGRGELERCLGRVGNLNQIYLLF